MKTDNLTHAIRNSEHIKTIKRFGAQHNGGIQVSCMAWSLDTLALMCLPGLYNRQLHLALLAVGGYEVLTAGSGSINSEGNEVILI